MLHVYLLVSLLVPSTQLECKLHKGRDFFFFLVCLIPCCLVTQLCLILGNSMDCSPPSSSVHGIFQAGIFPAPVDLPHPGIKPMSSVLAGGFFTAEPPGKPLNPEQWLECSKCSIIICGDFLVVQWLNSVLPMQGVQVWSLVRELRSCLPNSTARKKNKNGNTYLWNKEQLDWPFQNGIQTGSC